MAPIVYTGQFKVIQQIVDWINNFTPSGGSEVSYEEILQSGTKIGVLTIDGTDYDIYAPSGGSGSIVSFTQIQQTGTKIGVLTIDGTDNNIYAPSGGGGATDLNDLSDVTITNPTDGQALMYDSANSMWVNSALPITPGGSGGLSITEDVLVDTPFTINAWNTPYEISLYIDNYVGFGIELASGTANWYQPYFVTVEEVKDQAKIPQRSSPDIHNPFFISYENSKLCFRAVTNQSVTITKVTGLRKTEPFMNYSTEEHVVGKWIDGRDIYMKTVNFGALPNNTSKSVPHGITDMDLLLWIGGAAKRSTGIQIPLPYPYISGGAKNIGVYINDTYIYVLSQENVSVYTESYLSLLYVKLSNS